MDFIKKHYEKVLLSIVLLGLAGAAALLPLQVSSVRQYLEDTQRSLTIRSKPKLFTPADMTTNQIVVKRSKEPGSFNFASPHNVFNPVEWRKKPDGGLIKIATGKEAGPGAFVIEKIVPLYLSVSLDYVSGSGGQFRYHFTVLKETERVPRRVAVASLGVPNNFFTLRDVEGTPDAPASVRILLSGETQDVTISKEKPYSRVIGYAAELRYPLDNSRPRTYKKGDPIRVPRDAERYKIVAITQDEVVLSADSSKKRTTLKWKGAPKK